MASIKEKLEVVFGVSGADKFKREFEQADKTVQKSSKGMAAAMKKVGAAAVAYFSVQTVKAVGAAVLGMAQLADQFRVVQLSSERLSKSIGQNSQEILRAVRSGVGGAVSDLEILKQVNQAILLGIPVTAKEMGNMAQVATRLGRAVGRDAASALGDLVTGIGRMSPLILDNLGITIKAEEAFRGLGEGASDADKRLAFFTAVMDKAREKSQELGDQAPTVTEKIGKLDAAFAKFTRLLGEGFSPVVKTATDGLVALIEQANKALGNPAVVKLLNLPANVGITQGNKTGPMTYVPGRGFVPAGNATSGMQYLDPFVGPRRPGSGLLPPRLMGAQDVYRPGSGFGTETSGEIFERLTNTGGAYDGFVKGLSKSLKTKSADWKNEFKKIADAGGEEMARIPDAMQGGMSQAFANMGVQLSSLGLQGVGGAIGGAGNVIGGISSVRQFRSTPGLGIMGTLGQISAGFQAFQGAVQLFSAGVGLFRGAARALNRGSSDPNKNGQQIIDAGNEDALRNSAPALFSRRSDINAEIAALSGLDPNALLDPDDPGGDTVGDRLRGLRASLVEIQNEARNRGIDIDTDISTSSRTTGSNAYSVSTTITEAQANSIVAVLETQRAQDAERNNILGQSLAVQNDMKFLMSINSGNLTTFAG